MICDRPHVGVGVIIERDNKFLLMKRKGAHGQDTWSFPGGKLDKFETIEACAIRETKEETDLDISNVKMDRYTNDMFFKNDLHYITLFVRCDFEGEPKIMEPDKCSDIQWFDKDNLPKELFTPIENYITNYGF